MIAVTLLLIAAALLSAGATLSSFARSGPQETLGGVLICFGVLAGVIGGLLWSLGA